MLGKISEQETTLWLIRDPFKKKKKLNLWLLMNQTDLTLFMIILWGQQHHRSIWGSAERFKSEVSTTYLIWRRRPPCCVDQGGTWWGGGLLGDQLNHSVTQADTFNMYVSQRFYTVHKNSNLNHNKQQSVPVYEFVLSFNSSPPSRQDRMSSTTTLRVTQWIILVKKNLSLSLWVLK